jgi:hypothetical protein
MNLDWQTLKAAFREVLREEMGGGAVSIARRWEGGTVTLQPGDPSQKPKDIPIDALFKKVVSVRERLRVLEQKVNNSKSLSDSEKLELEGLITRAYGSLTTFNILFAEEEDKFTGQKSV